ncbi:YciI family protein [Rhizobium tubonense]|uniref:Dehydrogenase n=1 Tax=Rhizobium tubonense TaxID=484088 RepID=A0A2W4D3F9_9HYPH|nr:YciI family protein [Rhizobium tubonense]PZM17308.1 dehydrogenase [Rhizobium tubonense]
MKYLCQVWMEDGMVDAMSVEDKKKLDRDSLAYDEVLVERGQLIAAEALQSPRSAVTVRVRDGEVLTTDGPYAETKEQLGGFILIDAKDMNDAIRIAAGIPLAKLCSVEVRPIYDFSTEQ